MNTAFFSFRVPLYSMPFPGSLVKAVHFRTTDHPKGLLGVKRGRRPGAAEAGETQRTSRDLTDESFRCPMCRYSQESGS